MSSRLIRIGAASLALSLAGLASAAEHATPREARALFDQAVKYLQVNGPDQAWKAFNKRSGPFVKKDLYVYVIDRKGTYVANGAAPAQLVGLNVLDTVDAAGTPLFRQMIAVIGDSAHQHGSIGLHRRNGFIFCGTIHAVGYKFGRWLDGVIMQRALGPGDTTQPIERTR